MKASPDREAFSCAFTAWYVFEYVQPTPNTLSALRTVSWTRNAIWQSPSANALTYKITGGPVMQVWLYDVRFALRQLLRHRTYALTAMPTTSMACLSLARS